MNIKKNGEQRGHSTFLALIDFGAGQRNFFISHLPASFQIEVHSTFRRLAIKVGFEFLCNLLTHVRTFEALPQSAPLGTLVKGQGFGTNQMAFHR